MAGGRVVVEVRSVNHRFCEVALRLPSRYAVLEARLRKVVMDRIARGRVDLTLTIQPDDRAVRGPAIDWALAEGLRSRLEELKSRLGLSGEVDVALLAAQRGVLSGEEPASEPTWEQIADAAGQALAALASMRTQEGEVLEADLRGRLDRVGVLVEEIAARAPTVPQEYRDRLAGRLKALLESATEAFPGGTALLDPGRLEQEVALLADRADVTEELTRLRSHLGQIEALLTAVEPVGRKLEFLLQEIHREVNTIGSKSADLAIIRAVLELKAELERLREQVANVE